MSKNKIRIDKTCLNCNYVVEAKFCPNCGQENIETRKSFHHLFVHFFEDLTHYENAFWKTIKSLILKPAALTKEYLSGKRMSYLAPVRLYIFISFVTFFMFSILGNTKTDDFIKIQREKSKSKTEATEYKKDTIYKEQAAIIKLQNAGVIEKVVADSLQKYIVKTKEKNTDDDGLFELDANYTNVRELDSIQKYGKPKDKLGTISFILNRKIQEIKDKYSGKELKDKFVENMSHNIPKALFLYMPLFAFLLWLFHNKKRWYYFDHGIFTLHYFSFLLLGSLLINCVVFALNQVDGLAIFRVVRTLFKIGAISYMLYYFFPAHHRFYGGKRRTTLFLGVLLFVLNIIFLTFFLILFAIYSIVTIH